LALVLAPKREGITASGYRRTDAVDKGVLSAQLARKIASHDSDTKSEGYNN
jgi:hypothetical protein